MPLTFKVASCLAPIWILTSQKLVKVFKMNKCLQPYFKLITPSSKVHIQVRPFAVAFMCSKGTEGQCFVFQELLGPFQFKSFPHCCLNIDERT